MMSSIWLASAPAHSQAPANLISQYTDKRSSLENGRSVILSPIGSSNDRAGALARLFIRAAATLALACLAVHTANSVLSSRSLLQTCSSASVDPVFFDPTRSRSHRTTLRPSISFELNTLASTGRFPRWYGSPSEVGISPFDYILPEEWKSPQKWIVVAPSDEPADEELDAFTSAIRWLSPKFNLDVLDARSMAGLNKPGEAGPDLLVTFARHTSIESSSIKRWKSKRTTHIHILEECNGEDCVKDISPRNGQVTLARHPHELVDILAWNRLDERIKDFRMHLFAHHPFAADPNLYYPNPDWEEKTTAILDLRYPREVGPADYREAKICLLSSGQKRQMSSEWVKAMMSGCVILSDKPTESEEAVEAFAVLYETGAAPETIAAIAQAALHDVESMKRRALHAFIYARLNFTPLHQVGRILQLADQHKAGVRGYDFPMPFSLKCREYEDGLRPGWCGDSATKRS